MKEKKLIIALSVILVVFILSLGIFLAWRKIHRENLIKNATIIVELKEDRNVPFDSKAKLSDFIVDLNGELCEDFSIDTTELGTKKIEFKYVNEENIEIPYSFEIAIEDKTAPYVLLGKNYSVTTNFSGSLEEKILCADDYDDEPICKVEGEYDTKTVGKYNLNFHAEDSSGNKTDIPFVLSVNAPSSGGSSGGPAIGGFAFSTAQEKLKTGNVALGIDVSSWQGDIDFEKVKEAGVEFAFVRVGSKWGFDKDFFLDSKFHQNMKGFNEVGIPVGAYFYSYARNEAEAIEEAKWLLDNIKGYDVELPIAFDFEDWNNYNKYKMSIHRLNRNADAFIETVEKAGYKGMIYGSVNRLNKLLKTDDRKIWVAHYTTNADYSKSYKFWQFSASGRVPGINTAVDMDVMYK